jgi:AcrR family transcriptional regulator
MHSPNTRIKDKALVSARHQTIIEAARQVIRKKGFHAASVRDIAEAAAMTQGTLYNYVSSKDNILFLVCDFLISSYQRAITSAIQQQASPTERLAVALRVLVEQMHEHQDDLLLIYQESHLLTGEALHGILQRVSSFVDFFVELIQDAEARHEVSCRNAGIMANILTFLPTIVALRRWELRKRGEPDEVASELVGFMRRGLGLSSAPTAHNVHVD